MGVAQDVHRFGFHMGVTAVGWVVYKAIEAPSSSLSKSRVYASSSLVLSLSLLLAAIKQIGLFHIFVFSIVFIFRKIIFILKSQACVHHLSVSFVSARGF